jgi:hypothetical protein
MAYRLSGRRFFCRSISAVTKTTPPGGVAAIVLFSVCNNKGTLSRKADSMSALPSLAGWQICYCRVRDVEDGAATLPKNHQPHFGFSVERARDVRKLYFDLHDPSSE